MMQDLEQISLNAVRVFVVAAECRSFKNAAHRLGVTAGAVSRQVFNLDEVDAPSYRQMNCRKVVVDE